MQLLADTPHTCRMQQQNSAAEHTSYVLLPQPARRLNHLSCMPHDNCHAGLRSNRCCCSCNPCASLLQLQARQRHTTQRYFLLASCCCSCICRMGAK